MNKEEPASTWELMNDPKYTPTGQFQAAAVVNYFIWESDKYDYIVSSINSYYKSILEMSNKGWSEIEMVS